MNRADRGILVGMVLGDGYLNVRKRLQSGKYEYMSSEIAIKHSVAQVDYCQHKLDVLKGIFPNNNPHLKYADTTLSNGNSYRQCSFSLSNPYFRVLKGMMYPEGKKTYTQHVLDMLTPQGIAIWYMDDGSSHRNHTKEGWVSSVSTSIATMCSRQEVETIINYFLNEHGIEFKPRFRKASPEDRGWFIEANTKASRIFATLIAPYIIPSMLYKLSHVADLKLHECQTSKEAFKCKSCGTEDSKGSAKGLCRNCYKKSSYHLRLEKSMLYNRLKA